MDDSPDEAAVVAALKQKYGWDSYSLSLPSEPPDIRNWFPSYESPEDTELDTDHGAHNGSETQDPFEFDGVAVWKNRLGGQSENNPFDRKDLVPADENETALKKPAKRKQSLRALLGFIDNHEGATKSEFQVELPVERNALDPLPTCSATGFLDVKRSQEGLVNCSKVPVDWNNISSVDTQVGSPADHQEVEYNKLPGACVCSGLADNQKCSPVYGIDSIDHGKMLLDCEGISSVETHVSSPADDEHEYCQLPANCIRSSLADIETRLPEDSTDNIAHNKVPVPVDSDGISSVDTEASSPADQEVDYSNQAGLTDIHREDGIFSLEMTNNFLATNLANTANGSQDGPERNILPVCPHNIILSDTKENSSVQKVDLCKPAFESKGAEQTVASDGFITIKRKHDLPEECNSNKLPKCPMGRGKAALQENHSVLAGQNILAQENTRSPLADRTNFTEAAAAPSAVFCGKWKCPSKGKPRVGPPMRQLRLDQWLR